LSGASPANVFTIKPAPGVTPTLRGSTARALIVMNGADYVTIDGSNQAGGTTRDLTLVNLSTNAASAVIWGQTTSGGDPATNVTVKNAVLTGNDNNQTLFGAGFGGTTISLTSNGTGNNNNRVQNCLFKRVQFGVYSAGAGAANKNTGTVITQNNMDAAPTNSLGLSAAGIVVAQASSGTTTIVNNMISGVMSSALDPDLTVGIFASGGTGSTTRVIFNSISMTGDRGGASAPSFALAIMGS